MTWLSSTKSFLHRWMTRPSQELGRTGRTLRWVSELVWHCARELYYDRATEMAAALTYRTIFSLIPVLVLALVVFNAFGGFNGMGDDVKTRLFDYMGLSQLVLPPTDDANTAGDYPDEGAADTAGSDSPFPVLTPAPATDATAPAADAGAQSPPATGPPAAAGDEQHNTAAVREYLDHLIGGFNNHFHEIHFGPIAIVGVLLLIWAAVSLVVTVEQTFNRIFDSPVGRPWYIRIPIYWAVITLGPVLFGGSIWLTTFILGVAKSLGLGLVVAQSTQLGALALSWLLLFLLYVLMPSTKVAIRPALTGSFVSAVLFEQGKYFFGLYIRKFLPYSKLYGSLALIPLFLFWIYITWLFVLFGIELTYTLQAMRLRRFKHLSAAEKNAASRQDPQWLLPIMAAVGRAFADGKPLASYQVAQELNLPLPAVVDLLGHLEKDGWVHQVQSSKLSEPVYYLSHPPQGIPLAKLLDLSRRVSQGDSPRPAQGGWHSLAKLHQAQLAAAGEQTLADVLAVPAAS